MFQGKLAKLFDFLSLSSPFLLFIYLLVSRVCVCRCWLLCLLMLMMLLLLLGQGV